MKIFQCMITTSTSSNLEQSRVWNMSSDLKMRKSFIIGYLYDTKIMESMLGITGLSMNLRDMSTAQKNGYLRSYTRHKHQGKADEPKQDIFYSVFNKYYTPLYHASHKIMVVFSKRIGKLFVPKFYHGRKHNNFFKNLRFVGEIDKIDQGDFTEVEEFCRKLYEHKDPSNLKKFTLNSNLDWSMPKTYKSIGVTVEGFSFTFPNTKKKQKRYNNSKRRFNKH